jgi:ABC-type Na+ efflux pump permease subunit
VVELCVALVADAVAEEEEAAGVGLRVGSLVVAVAEEEEAEGVGLRLESLVVDVLAEEEAVRVGLRVRLLAAAGVVTADLVLYKTPSRGRKENPPSAISLTFGLVGIIPALLVSSPANPCRAH